VVVGQFGFGPIDKSKSLCERLVSSVRMGFRRSIDQRFAPVFVIRSRSSISGMLMP
jgi:hypothetical protein